jgi:hypothetical protein
MSKKSVLCVWGLSVLLAWLPSCSSSSTCQGGEMCACYANDTCNAGLSCRSHTCVNLNDGTSGGAGGGVSSSKIDTQACLACADKSCTSEASACKAASGCEASLSCFLNCGTDATCEANCAKGLTTDSGAKAVSYYSCAVTQCVSDCVYVPGTGGSGNSGGSSAATGGTGNHGGSGSSLGGTSNSGGTSSDGGIGGGAPMTELTTGTNWLTLVADGAPPDQGVNGKLNINGVLYAYGDGCATLNWNPSSRCLSGDLCVGSATNWGVAVGFDFNNSGAMGVPPDTKHAWNANAVAASGLAWRTMGSVPNGLQVWVLNMDPSFGGTCSVKSCDINGPPDGTANASSSGQFSFATMMKDDWGGTGTAYTFNPTDISALQFKVTAALDSIDTSYELCVESIGVVR